MKHSSATETRPCDPPMSACRPAAACFMCASLSIINLFISVCLMAANVLALSSARLKVAPALPAKAIKTLRAPFVAAVDTLAKRRHSHFVIMYVKNFYCS